MKYVKLTMTFTVSGATDLDAQTDLVMDELTNLEAGNEALRDSDLSASLRDGQVVIAIVGLGRTFDEAQDVASSAIRAAIHAAGGSTPKWKQPIFDPTSSEAQLVSA